jgi:glycosyltransferase involved in cell wall biosynthesis
MKVLMIVTKLYIGGTETYVLSLAEALRKQGVQVGIATSGGPLMATCQRLGIPVHTFPATAAHDSAQYARYLSAILTNNAYQIAHAHDPRSIRAVHALLQVFAIPVVVTLHGTYYEPALIRSLAQQASAVIAVSPALSKWVQRCGVSATRVKVIPNGIDTAYFTPAATMTEAWKALQVPQNGTIIAYAGRFSWDKKGIAQKIISAGERINRLNPNVYTVLVGPGTYRADLAKRAAQANQRLGRRAIIVRPAITNIRTLYRSANLVIGTGRVLLEAMACGKPVLAAGVKGYLGLVTPKHITHAVNCHFGDHAADTPLTVDALVNDSTSIRKTPELAHSLSKFGRDLVVQRFSISHVAGQINTVYQQCFFF